MGRKKFGWIPNATTPRATFINEILPLFYKSMYFHCRNAREFQKLFHDEGRREYDLKSSVARLEERIASVMNPRNPAAAGKYFCEYILTSSGKILLSNNIKVIQSIKSSIQKKGEEVQKHLSSHFTKSGKVLPGHEYPRKFDEDIKCKTFKGGGESKRH